MLVRDNPLYTPYPASDYHVPADVFCSILHTSKVSGKFMHIIYSKNFICLRLTDWDRQRSKAFALNVVEPSLLSRLPQSGCEVS
jgi:hypothetical protein